MRDFLTGMAAGAAIVVLVGSVSLVSLVDYRVTHWRQTGIQEGAAKVQEEAVNRGLGRWNHSNDGKRSFIWDDYVPSA